MLLGISDTSLNFVKMNNEKTQRISHWMKVVLYILKIKTPNHHIIDFAEDIKRNEENDILVRRYMELFEKLKAVYSRSILSGTGLYAIRICNHPRVVHSSIKKTRVKEEWNFVKFSKRADTKASFEDCNETDVPCVILCLLKEAIKRSLHTVYESDSKTVGLASCNQQNINDFIREVQNLFDLNTDGMFDKGYRIKPEFQPVAEIVKYAPYLRDKILMKKGMITGFLKHH